MKVSITEEHYRVVQSKLLYEETIDEIVFKLSLLTEDGKTKPDMEWDFEPVKKEIDLSKLWVKTKEDALKYVRHLKEKIQDLSPKFKQRILKYVLYSFLGLLTLDQIEQYLDPSLQSAVETEKEIIKKVTPPRIRKSSENLIDHLKYEEGSIRHKGQPNLVAYDLGDGAYTIGYGHAIFPNEEEGFDFLPRYSKIVPGKTKITKEDAEKLLKDDMREAESIVNRILDQWEEKVLNHQLHKECTMQWSQCLSIWEEV